MIYVWRASFGTWVIRQAIIGDNWTLLWHDTRNQPLKASHFADPQSAVDAVMQKKTGVSDWDNSLGMSWGRTTLAGWEAVDHFPYPRRSDVSMNGLGSDRGRADC